MTGRRSGWGKLLTDRLARRRWRVLVALIGAVLVAGTAHQAHLAHRFQRYGEIVDAQIHDSDHGCIFAAGRPDLPIGPRQHIVYEISFPTADGVHHTTVRRPCSVIPPDFGRGRGAIWVEYDTANPDRVRVQSDRTAEVRAGAGLILLGLFAVAVTTTALVRRGRTPTD